MYIQTLISTMNQSSLDFIKSINVETDVVIGNQNGENSIKNYKIGKNKIKVISSSTKGLAKNRNITIKHSTADVCILSDDDVIYIPGYSRIVNKAFESITDADVIIFNIKEDPVVRHVIKKKHRVRGLEFLRYGSVRIAFKKSSVIKKVKFDERFGAGGKYPIGEDTIFLSDCLKAGLRIYALPEYILKIPQSDSTWFAGYTDDYFINKGKMYNRIFGLLTIPMILQDAIRHRKDYCKCGSICHNINMMIIGMTRYIKEGK